MPQITPSCAHYLRKSGLEVAVTDASEFSTHVEVTAARIGTHRVLRGTGPSVPNVLAAVLLAVSDKDDMPSHIYFEWSERAPGQNALRFLFAGEGDVPPLTHEILRRAEPDPDDTPHGARRRLTRPPANQSTRGRPERPEGHTQGMLHLRITTPSDLTEQVLAVFTGLLR